MIKKIKRFFKKLWPSKGQSDPKLLQEGMGEIFKREYVAGEDIKPNTPLVLKDDGKVYASQSPSFQDYTDDKGRIHRVEGEIDPRGVFFDVYRSLGKWPHNNRRGAE